MSINPATIRHWGGLAIAVLALTRFVRVAVAVRKRREKWTQLLLPAFIAVEFLRIERGSSDRMASAYILIASELILACACLIAVLRSRETGRLAAEQRIFRTVRLFLPSQLASIMTQELMILAAIAGVDERTAPPVKPGEKDFGYVQASPLRFLPIILAFLSVPETLVVHFALKGHRVLAGMLIVVAVWSVVWALGLFLTMRNRPHILCDDALTLRMGVRRWCVVPLPDVAIARRIDPYHSTSEDEVYGDFSVKHCPRLQLKLSRPATVTTLEGMSNPVRELWVTADDMDDLFTCLSSRIKSASCLPT